MAANRTETSFAKGTALVLLSVLVVTVGCEQPTVPGTLADARRAREMRVELTKAAAGDNGSEGAAGQTATGWATLTGTIKVGGQAPARQPLLVNRDVSVCAPGGEVLDEQVVVDSSGGLANVAIYALKLTGELVHEDAQPGKQDEVVFDQKACIFLTHVAVMQSSQRLKILNSDPVAHNTDIKVKRSAPKNVNLPPGDSFEFTPGREENEPASVSCAIHPWMRAYLLPRDNSYVAVSAPDGSFEIPNLPAGVDVTLQVWHEKAGKKFNATVEGDAEWKRGRIVLQGENQLADGQNRTITIVIPADEF